ncbi:hypothetical protein GOBAR_DD27849 [Gossypium barbadense]|nr:hypothetical protein GOBAR_DD27849 [Gossypium barbadense]
MEGIEQGTPNSSPAEELISVVEGMDDNAIRNVEERVISVSINLWLSMEENFVQVLYVCLRLSSVVLG